jgi:hypothetical protein
MRPRRLLAALAVTAVAAVTIVACGPATGSPNCPPGQWYVDSPGSGWECVPGKTGTPVFVPSAFAPSSPSGSAP